MTKCEILDFFAQTGGFLTPDELRVRLHWRLDRRSAYSYLQRLARQGLLERSPWGQTRLPAHAPRPCPPGIPQGTSAPGAALGTGRIQRAVGLGGGKELCPDVYLPPQRVDG